MIFENGRKVNMVFYIYNNNCIEIVELFMYFGLQL